MSEPNENRPKLELSPIKVAAGAAAAATAAAIGSTLGVAGTIAGAAVASVVSASASALIGHSLERGTVAAKKALPLTAFQVQDAVATEVFPPTPPLLEASDRPDQVPRVVAPMDKTVETVETVETVVL